MNAPAQIRQMLRLAPEQIAALPWESLHGMADATSRLVWRDQASLAGFLRLEPGAQLPEHVHDDGHHHVYVLEGLCGVDSGSDPLPAGSYVHVPAGTRHGLRAVGPESCVVFYLFLEDR